MKLKTFLCFILTTWVATEVTDALRNRTRLFGKRRNFLSTRTFKTVCYGELGCFDSGPPFHHPVWRPISIAPLPPHVQMTAFHLYTRRNRAQALVFAPDKLEALHGSFFEGTRWTRILVHGLFDGVRLSTWMRATKDSYLDLADENVILVDYGSKLPPLFLDAANARVIGAQIWLLIAYLEKHFGATPEKFHIIGHSLGAHIAGYAGERLHNLGRITGLDPTGPYFRNVPNKVKLDTTDALSVDVIHSNPAKSFLQGAGTVEDLGHVNFWPAGGKPPGCPQTQLKSLTSGVLSAELLQSVFLCRHFRSVDFFRFSFGQGGCFFVGAECEDWGAFSTGRCHCGQQGERCRVMGQFGASAHYETRYFLRVGKERPYCLHQYQVIVYFELAHFNKTYGSRQASLHLVVDGAKSTLDTLHFNLNLMQQRQFKTFLLTFATPLDKIRDAVGMVQLPFHESSIGISIEAIEINYLFPLPKEKISSLVCKHSEVLHGYRKQTLLSKSACKTIGEVKSA